MNRTDNYLLQAAQAKHYFLGYDQEALIRKLNLQSDSRFLYATLLGVPYRVCRSTGNLDKYTDGGWADANTHGEVMTLFDLICDSKESRFLSGRWKNMADFGLMFHQALLESARDPWAERFQDDLEGFHRACKALNGKVLPFGDAAYAIELFDGLCIVLQLWLGDDEFPPNLRYLWDENAMQYLKYETMYFARGLVLDRLKKEMEK